MVKLGRSQIVVSKSSRFPSRGCDRRVVLDRSVSSTAHSAQRKQVEAGLFSAVACDDQSCAQGKWRAAGRN